MTSTPIKTESRLLLVPANDNARTVCTVVAVEPLSAAERPLNVSAYEPCQDTLSFEWTGDEAAAERAFERFCNARENNPTVQAKRGYRVGRK